MIKKIKELLLASLFLATGCHFKQFKRLYERKAIAFSTKNPVIEQRPLAYTRVLLLFLHCSFFSTCLPTHQSYLSTGVSLNIVRAVRSACYHCTKTKRDGRSDSSVANIQLTKNNTNVHCPEFHHADDTTCQVFTLMKARNIRCSNRV